MKHLIALEHELADEEREDVDRAEAMVQEVDDRTEVEKEEDWLYFHLDCARRSRLRIEQIGRGSAEFPAEHGVRRQAVLSAMKHFDLLRRMGATVPPLLESMMKAEGL